MNEIVFIALWLILWGSKLAFCLLVSGILFAAMGLFIVGWLIHLIWTHRKI